MLAMDQHGMICWYLLRPPTRSWRVAGQQPAPGPLESTWRWSSTLFACRRCACAGHDRIEIRRSLEMKGEQFFLMFFFMFIQPVAKAQDKSSNRNRMTIIHPQSFHKILAISMYSVHYWPFFHNPTPSLISGFENTTKYNPDLALSENRLPLRFIIVVPINIINPVGRFITCIPWNKPQKHGWFGMIWGYPQPLGTRHLTSKHHETSSGWWF